MLSEAVAESCTIAPETVAPDAGAVREMEGGVVSEGGGGTDAVVNVWSDPFVVFPTTSVDIIS